MFKNGRDKIKTFSNFVNRLFYLIFLIWEKQKKLSIDRMKILTIPITHVMQCPCPVPFNKNIIQIMYNNRNVIIVIQEKNDTEQTST